MNLSQSMQATEAIDVHGHIGQWRRQDSPKNDALSGRPELVMRRAELAGIRITFISAIDALSPEEPDPTPGNATARAAAEQYDSLRFYAVLNPTLPHSFADVAELLDHTQCVGVNIHPREHQYEIRELGQAVFEFSAQRQAVVLTHSGNPGCWPQDFIPFMNAIPEARLILAHLGHDEVNETFVLQTEAIKQAQAGNVYTDTSSSNSVYSGLIEYAVNEIGAERILFGTDSPIHFSPVHKLRIELAEIDQAAKQAILWKNAERLFADRLQRGCDQ